MSFDWEFVRGVAIAVSAVVAMLTFVISSLSERRKRRSVDVRQWQKVVIAELFQSKTKGTMTFDEILRSYQAEANEFSNVKLKSGELSRQTLRRILVELVSGGIIEQGEGDNFLLNSFQIHSATHRAEMEKSFQANMKRSEEFFMSAVMPESRGSMEAMSASLSSVIEKIGSAEGASRKIVAEIVNRVHESPGKMRASDVILAVSQVTDAPPAVVRLQCNLALSGGVLTEDTEGLLWPPIKSIGGKP